ncbi:MAG: carbohydrate ABC transporter substrate-binding protein [Clostridiales bacterium]|nr:carbohydrate ABC transporter substrate-binding protein [Clostridiales bacterium]
MYKRSLPAVILLIVSLMLCSCRSNNSPVTRVEGINSYRLRSLELNDDPSYHNSIIAADKVNGINYALESSYKFISEDSIEQYLTLYKFDDEGNILGKTGIEAEIMIQMEVASISDRGILIPLTDGMVALFDLETGELKKKSQDDDSNYVIGLSIIPDGFVVVREGSITKLDNDLTPVSVINDNLIVQVSATPFFVEDNKYYLELDDGYYNVDFDKNSIDKVLNYSDLPVLQPEPYGKYVVGSQGLFEINIGTLALKTLADFNYVNVRPATRAAEYRYFCLDDMHFVKSYSYAQGGAELDLYIYDSSLDQSGVKQIVIGGYGVGLDLPLKQAVYQFNSTHKDYRIFLEDYSVDYSWNDAEEAQAALLKLLKHFSEGKAPDIFYGEHFDYEYFGRMGLVCDLMPYINSNDITSRLYPSVAETMTGKGHCYSMFSSYSLEGYFGLESVFGDGDLTFEDLANKAEESGIPPVYSAMAYDISDGIIRYPLNTYIASRTGEHVLDKSDLKKIIEYSTQYGVGSYEEIPAPKSMIEGEVLTERTGLSTVYDYYNFSASMISSEHRSLAFLGFPAVRGNMHGISAKGLCAISDSSKYKDVCWEFMSYLLSDDVQRYVVSEGQIPVCKEYVDKMIEYAVDPDSIPENEMIFREMADSGNKGKPLPKEVGEEYKRILDKIDTVISYDWGLFDIIYDEIMTYYTQKKSVDEIAGSLQSRLDVYVNENYSGQ